MPMLPAAGRNPARKRLSPGRFPTGKPIASKPEADLRQPTGWLAENAGRCPSRRMAAARVLAGRGTAATQDDGCHDRSA